jgi:hypothetical protein
VKRKTLNAVVSPEMNQLGEAEALALDASNRERRVRTSDALRPGVTDGIEQHTVNQ